LTTTPKGESKEATADDVSRLSYRRAAAVLDSFTFPTLQPVDPAARVIPVAGGEAGKKFTLSLTLRQAALRELGTREAMTSALSHNPSRPLTDMQVLWEQYLASGTLPVLESLGFQELTRVCQLLSWLNGIDQNLPSLEHAERRLRRRSVYTSFEHLVASNFTGRSKELKMLRDHIGALPPAKGLSAALMQLRDWSGLSPKPILMLHGVGGIGKSALIGRLLWEHAEVDNEARFPFAYLAFDQPWLRVDTPHTMLAEAATQLEMQYAQHSQAFSFFRDGVLRFRDSRGALYRGRAPMATRGLQGSQSNEFDEELFVEFAKLLRAIGARQVEGRTVYAPVVLVFDTFEEVQYRDREVLSRFWRMLDLIQDHYSQLRAIICGRAAASSLPMRAPKMREELLAELGPVDRVSLLQRLGVLDTQTATAVAEQVGGNPLTLRLAADVVLKEEAAIGARGIDNIVTRRLLFFQLDERLIQGQLYRRVLNHIHDERVRRLAHPGMVLRRIDPEVILNVLAPVCMPELTSPSEAAEIFEALRRENTLVLADTRDDALVYRSDIRSALLRLLERDRFDEVRRLRRAAVQHYQELDGDIARGEEMFHRLALGEDEPWQLDQRWDDSARAALASSLDEFSDPMKAWLASRMSIEVPRSVFANADLAQWERNITRKVQLAISDVQLELARELLNERKDRSAASPLFALEAKLLLSRPEWLPEAADVIERGIASLATSTNRGRLAELFWLRSQLNLALPQPDISASDASLAEAQRAIEQSANPIPLLHVLGQRLLLRRERDLSDRATREALEQELAGLCERLTTEQVHSAGIAAVLAGSLLDGRVFPNARRRLELTPSAVSQEVQIDLLTDDLQGLDEYREPWELDALDASRIAKV
jgi:hypothetical protein